MSAEQSLTSLRETETGEAFSLQNHKLLKVELSDVTIQAKLGSMVAYQGDVKFEHAGSGGMTRMLKKAATGEGTKLMKISGSGEVFLADTAQEIQLLQLNDERITVNGPHLLAFDAGIDWDIKKVDGAGAGMAAGLFNTELKGTGTVAVLSDGPPLLLEVDGEGTHADPSAAITWSDGVSASVKTDVSLKTFIGKGSGEGLQVAFGGSGWVLIQPSEGRVTGTEAGEGGVGGALGRMLGG